MSELLAPPLPPLASQLLSPKLSSDLSMRALDGPADRDALLAHWLALSPECLRLRFFYSPSPHALRERAQSMDFRQPRVVGIFDAQGTLVCSAQWAREAAGVAEIAFSTLSAHRGQGLAKLAVGACAIDARESGISKLRLETMRRNIPAKRLCHSMGGAPEPSEELLAETIVHHIDLESIERAHFNARR